MNGRDWNSKPLMHTSARDRDVVWVSESRSWSWYRSRTVRPCAHHWLESYSGIAVSLSKVCDLMSADLVHKHLAEFDRLVRFNIGRTYVVVGIYLPQLGVGLLMVMI